MDNNIYYEDKLDILLYNYFENNEECNEQEYKKSIDFYKINEDITKERYIWLKKMNINPNIIHLKENHNLIYEIFDNCNNMLNENKIEYYYTSGILSYLLINKDLERYHHDLDIFINMKDLHKLEKICNKYDFSFKRKIGNRTRDEHRIMLKMYYKNLIDIPITIFMFIRQLDGSIIQNDYYIDKNYNLWLEKINNSPEIVDLSFDLNPHYHNVKYYAITLEALYLSKLLGNRFKDIYDCKQIANYVDYKKLEKLKNAFKNNKHNEIVDARFDDFFNFIFSDSVKKRVLKNDRL